VNDPATVLREYATEDRFLARRLTAWAELHGPLVEDATVDAVAEGEPARVLDVGCGTGDFSERLQRQLAVDLVALDLSPRMVDLARARGLNAMKGEVQALPFADEEFDCVLANRVLYHVPDLDKGLAEIARVLRPGGRLVAVTYSADHLRELWDLVGQRPLASSPFSAENGTGALSKHFDSVERRDFTGSARFPSRSSILGFLAAYGEFSDFDLGAQLGDVQAPFTASYRHSVFLAHKHI
jgi:SAM-dependent methyltransferase